jgi:ABC-type polysaccharide/polyol phosphate export permease
MGPELKAAWAYRELLRNLVLRDLRHKYKGSSLGFAWSLLHPLLMATVYTLAFRVIARIQIEHFPLFLLSGLLPWMFFSAALSSASGSIVDNSPLVRKVSFPRLILPLSAVGSQFVQFLLMYTVIAPMLIIFGVGFSPVLLGLIPLIALQAVFTVGLGLALATAYVYARDTRHLLDVALQVWFWVTPVVYSTALLPATVSRFIAWNPMAHFVSAYHSIIVDQQLPSAGSLAVLAASAAGAWAIGMLVFERHQRRFAERV